MTFVAAPALQLTKSASPSDPTLFVEGASIVYSFVVRNTGNVRIDGISIVEGAFTGSGPAPNVTCPEATLDAGAEEVCTATPYLLTSMDVQRSSVENSATATGTAVGETALTVSNMSSFSVPAQPAPALTVVKTAGPSTADAAGDALTYTFHVTNVGNVSVQAVTIADSGFTGTGAFAAPTCPSRAILPGESVDCTSVYRLTQADVDAGHLDNTATASGTPEDGTLVPSPPSSVTTELLPQPAVTFVKSSDTTAITAADQTVRYSFTVSNVGNVTLRGLVISDTGFTGAGVLGDISCPVTVVAPGDSVRCTAEYTTVAADLTTTAVENTATAQLQTPGNDALTSDPSTRSITVTPPAPPVDPGPGVSTPLAFTGTDPIPVAVTGAAILVLGLTALAVGWLRRRRS